MKLENGRLYQNKTLSYLVPAMFVYGELFSSKLNFLQKLAFGIFDKTLEGTHLEGQQNIFCLVSTNYRPLETPKFLDWFKYQEYYVTDYAVGTDSKMLVLQFPESLGETYRNFMESKYSLMYTREEISMFFKHSSQDKVSQVLRKTMYATLTHIEQVNQRFDTKLVLRDIVGTGEPYEAEFPWTYKEEVFNF